MAMTRRRASFRQPASDRAAGASPRTKLILVARNHRQRLTDAGRRLAVRAARPLTLADDDFHNRSVAAPAAPVVANRRRRNGHEDRAGGGR